MIEWITNERIPWEYREKQLEPRLTSVSAYLQVCMISKDHCTSSLIAVEDVKYLDSKVCMLVTIFELRSLLHKVENSKISAIAEQKSRQVKWRTYFAG